MTLNYKAVSLTSVVYKLLEEIIRKQEDTFLGERNYLNERNLDPEGQL